MKNTLLIFLFLPSIFLPGQPGLQDTILQYDLFYSDSANGEFAFGDYRPNDIVKLEDGTFLIGSELSILFPSQYSQPKEYDSLYFYRTNIYNDKSHIGSGSIIKVNNNFEKEWETIIDGQRVKKILKTDNGRILVVGEHVQMKFIWMAELNQNGNIIWEKRYKYKSQVTISDALIDSTNSVFILLEAANRIPIQYHRDRRKKFSFYRIRESNSHLALLKLSTDGKKKWLKMLKSDNKTTYYGGELVNGTKSIFASYHFSKQLNDSMLKGKKVAQINSKGKITNSTIINKQRCLFYQNHLISGTWYSKGEVMLYQDHILLDSIYLQSDRQSVALEKAIVANGNFYLLGEIINNHQNYLVIEIGPDLLFDNYWTYPSDEFHNIIDAVVMDNRNLLILGQCYKDIQQGSKTSASYINIMVVKPSDITRRPASADL